MAHGACSNANHSYSSALIQGHNLHQMGFHFGKIWLRRHIPHSTQEFVWTFVACVVHFNRRKRQIINQIDVYMYKKVIKLLLEKIKLAIGDFEYNF